MRRIVQRDPDGYRVECAEGPKWDVQMKRGGVRPCALEQGLVVPNADAIRAGQQRRDFPKFWAHHQLSNATVGLPEIDELIKYVGVIFGVLINAIVIPGLEVRPGDFNAIAFLNG